MYLSSQLSFKNPNKTLQFQDKNQEKCNLQQSADLNLKNFPVSVNRGSTPWTH